VPLVCLSMTAHKLTMIAPRFSAALVLLTAAVACSNDDNEASEPARRIKVVLDYSPTLSDAGALLYLASNPAVDLLAVTLPGTGEADCEPAVRITRALLTVADSSNVPLGCGRNEPLAGDRDWPEEWRESASHLGEGLLPTVQPEALVDAEQLLADTLRAATAPVTLVAVGPLTNLGVVLADEPELVEHVERIVIMGGAVTVPGNVEASPGAEWNIYIDPEAARRVIAAGVAVTFVPLDATNYVSWTDRLLSRLAALETDAGNTVHELATARDSLDGFYLWDELAAMVAVTPTLVTTESMTVRIDDDGAIVRDPQGFAVDVAINADADAAMDEFVRALNGGTPAPVATLTADELGYLVQMGGADSSFSKAVSLAFGGVDETDPDLHGMADLMLNGFVDAADELLVMVRDVSPPSAVRAAHSEYADALSEFVASRDDLLAAAAAAEGVNLDELLNNVLVASGINKMFERMNLACQALVDYSFLRGGPRPCSAGG